jgi:hypothetical protein
VSKCFKITMFHSEAGFWFRFQKKVGTRTEKLPVWPRGCVRLRRVDSNTVATHSSPWWWRQHVPLKRWSTIILHGSTSQKTNLNFILAAVRTWNLTWFLYYSTTMDQIHVLQAYSNPLSVTFSGHSFEFFLQPAVCPANSNAFNLITQHLHRQRILSLCLFRYVPLRPPALPQ